MVESRSRSPSKFLCKAGETFSTLLWALAFLRTPGKGGWSTPYLQASDALWMSMLLSAFAGLIAISVVIATFYFIRCEPPTSALCRHADWITLPTSYKERILLEAWLKTGSMGRLNSTVDLSCYLLGYSSITWPLQEQATFCSAISLLTQELENLSTQSAI